MNELQRLSLPELIDRLADLSMPDPVPLVPQTESWWLLGGAVSVVVTLVLHRCWRGWRAGEYRREALRALQAIERHHLRDPSSRALADIATLLRRTALAAFPRDKVAALHGEAWLRFLDERYGATGFGSGPGRILLAAPYANNSGTTNEDAQELVRVVRTWIRRHHA